MYYPLLTLKRGLIAPVLVLGTQAWIQLVTIIGGSVTFTFYLCIMRPFKDSMTNAVAITGEIFMLIFYSIMIIYHFGIVDTASEFGIAFLGVGALAAITLVILVIVDIGKSVHRYRQAIRDGKPNPFKYRSKIE